MDKSGAVLERLLKSQIHRSLLFLCFFSGCFCSFFLQSQFQLNSVLSAALVGFLGSFIPENRHIQSLHTHALIYTGAFVSMGHRVVQLEVVPIALISLLGTGLYLGTRSYFKGLGGRLGALAFITSLLGLVVKTFL